MKIFSWAAQPDGCAYYRSILPMASLTQMQKADALAGIKFDDFAQNADVVFGQRILEPDNIARWNEMATKGRALVYEIDDDLWSVPEDNPAKRFYHPATLARMEENIGNAALVTVSTEPLAKVVSAFNPNVMVVPNYIDTALLRHQRIHRDRLVIGWAGSPTHRHDLALAAKALRRVLDFHKRVDLHLIGTDYRRLFGGRGRFTPWAPWVPSYYRIVDFDIGLAPLADTVFNSSKSHIKALEYAALGIPVIASDTGPYAGFVQHGVTGFLADDRESWTHFLRELIRDDELRAEMGRNARAQAEQWTMQAHCDEWLNAARMAVAT